MSRRKWYDVRNLLNVGKLVGVTLSVVGALLVQLGEGINLWVDDAKKRLGY